MLLRGCGVTQSIAEAEIPATTVGVAIAAAAATVANRAAHRRRIRPVIVSSLLECLKRDAGVDHGRRPDQHGGSRSGQQPSPEQSCSRHHVGSFPATICRPPGSVPPPPADGRAPHPCAGSGPNEWRTDHSDERNAPMRRNLVRLAVAIAATAAPLASFRRTLRLTPRHRWPPVGSVRGSTTWPPQM